ncbi:MAG TPA: methyltransferase domain-containing protein [Nitrospirota bacterium]|nr:methyltransferase domain-containing protein [Nitrospirota bacterium]
MSEIIKNELRDIYDRYARTRDNADRPSWKIRERQYALDAFIRNNSGRILEIGAGTGQDSLFFKENSLDVTAIDLSEEHVSCCIEKDVHAITMDVYEMKFEDAYFDGIYSINCFLHVPKKDLPKVLYGARRILRTGGLFYLGVYGDRDYEGKLRWTDYNDEERFFAFYMFEDYQRILGSVFKIKDARVITLKDDLIYHAFLLEK